MTKQITDYVNEILDEPELKKMRDAIANGIFLTYQDAIKNGNANMEVSQARGSYPSLAERLIAELDIINKKITKGQVTMTDLTQEVKEALTGGSVAVVGENSTGTVNLIDKAVTPIKTTFFNASTNLINPNNVQIGYRSDENGQTVQNENTVLITIPVTSNTTYSHSGGISGRVNFFSDEAGTMFISTKSGVGSNVVTTPKNTKIMKITMQKSNYTSTAMVNAGSVLLPYEPYRDEYLKQGTVVNDSLIDNSIRPEKLSFIKTSSNLFDVNSLEMDKRADETGEIVTATGVALHPKIYVDANNLYSFNVGGAARINCYGFDDKLIQTQTTKVGVPLTVDIPNGTDYILVTVQKAQVDHIGDQMQINKGGALLPYEPYHAPYIDKALLPEMSSTSTSNANIYKQIPNEFITIQAKDAWGEADDDFNTEEPDYNQVIAKYDELVALAPNYVSKRTLGLDSSGTYTLYAYSFADTPVNVVGGVASKKPKITITVGVHGGGQDETETRDSSLDGLIPTTGDYPTHVFSAYYFFENIVKNWKSNPALEYLRHYVDFEIIPVVNPWGFENKSRYNSNWVDLNRNTPYQFTQGQGTGDAPLDQAETEIMWDFLTEATSDNRVVFHIDWHTIGGLNFVLDGSLILIMTHTDLKDVQRLSEYSISKISRNWEAKGRLFQPDSHSQYSYQKGYIQVNNNRYSSNSVYSDFNLPAITFESFMSTHRQKEIYGKNNSKETIEMNAEAVANIVIEALRYYA